jgi:hypothetical protein
MSEVELYPGRVSPLGLGTIPHADILKYTGLELCSASSTANIRRRRFPFS